MDYPPFSPAPPKNAISDHHGTPKTCDHCGRFGKQRCSQCPLTEPTYYCSKECQKSDWRKHKNFCRSKQLYAAVVDLWLPKSEPLNTERLKAIVEKCKVNLSTDLREYLGRVPVAARPRTMLGHDRPTMVTPQFIEVQQQLSTTDRAAYEQRVTLLQQTKYKGTQPWDVPLGDRPLAKGGEFIDKGTLTWWVDYQVLSIGHYVSNWGNGRHTVNDPWHVESIPLDDIVMVAPAQFVRRKDYARWQEDRRLGKI